ncbi:MAG: hypothetical protein A2622_14325 [Bdellovibrionales bacterium RIFCSPHIGHO2_01_FULL_40_29]|nr:MAG: hypothetical protein A2622_14325 [Bdellovibrionales bacterium RIFCSPHIGHO2_01_FULL_40_29]OFZ33695.1 MAG: hypothetical protein A3D17_11935 [Bdellovibrionales bacterium RIFCSPHIGHO2_02_FULL_40_15]
MDKYTDKQQREVFHLLFLERLLRTTDPHMYALKGGVNLRFFFKSPRYSEDMDLDVFGGSVETLKKNGYKILNDPSFLRNLQTYGIREIKINDLLKAKHTDTTQRFRLRLINNNGDEFPTKVEFSRRKKIPSQPVLTEIISPEIALSYKKLSFQCPHYAAEFAIAQKIQALGGRTEVQARDVFDLYIFYLSGHMDKNKITANTTVIEREKALNALLSLDFLSYQGQVVEYLERESKLQFASSSHWDQICETIVGFLDESN